MSKHTPGPWEARCQVIHASDGKVATCYRHPLVAHANAHLIAAAPEMLELLECLSNTDDTGMIKAYRYEIDTLIAKAKGEAQ